ncbi:hypothetical protein GmHk_14G041673 [Glycine max]|nr:hypothetical protein GmHk_14G041673 [Glycine max]
MASKKRKTPSTPTQTKFDRSRFTSQEAWERYTDIVLPRKLLPERNVVIYYTEFDEFKEELERRHWDEKLTDFSNNNIDIAIVKEFYANLYDPEELAAKLCIPGRGFELNADGQPLKILRKNMNTLAQTWSVLSFSNLIPTSHTSDITLDRAALITALYKARGVISDSLTLESLDPAINVAYVKKNCWNLDDLSVTFRGPRKANGKRFEAPPSSEVPPSSAPAPIPSVPFASTSVFPAPLSAGPSEFIFTPQMSPAFSSGGGGASAAQEPASEEPTVVATEGEDELTPPEPSYFDAGIHMAKEEDASTDQIPEPSPTPIPDDATPFALAPDLEQPISQDSPTAQVLDLNDAQEQPQDEQDI